MSSTTYKYTSKRDFKQHINLRIQCKTWRLKTRSRVGGISKKIEKKLWGKWEVAQALITVSIAIVFKVLRPWSSGYQNYCSTGATTAATKAIFGYLFTPS